jgi:hypothetical protein
MVGALLSIASFKRVRLFSILLIALDMVVLVEAGEALAEYDEEEEPLTKDVGFRSLLNIWCSHSQALCLLICSNI